MTSFLSSWICFFCAHAHFLLVTYPCPSPCLRYYSSSPIKTKQLSGKSSDKKVIKAATWRIFMWLYFKLFCARFRWFEPKKTRQFWWKTDAGYVLLFSSVTSVSAGQIGCVCVSEWIFMLPLGVTKLRVFFFFNTCTQMPTPSSVARGQVKRKHIAFFSWH